MPLKGFSFNYSRVWILNALVSFGGSCKSANASKALYDRMVELGFDTKALNYRGLNLKLTKMEEEGLILRDVAVKRTREIIIDLDAVTEPLLSMLTLSSPLQLDPVEESSKPTVQVASDEITAEEIASSLLARVVEVLSKPEPSVVVHDDQTKQKLADALKELESLRISLSSAKARIASLEQENSVLKNNVQKLANSRVVVDDRVGRDLAVLVNQPKTTK